jgi:outer membrane murein-binding lipoprotein Lpp
MKLVHAVALAPLILAGCATSPKDIAAAYVSPVAYQAMNCDQLGQEAQRVSAAAAAATGQQQSQANKDTAAMAVSLIVFWPAIFFVGGDKANAAEVSRLKGEMNAIQQASVAKGCGITFQQG